MAESNRAIFAHRQRANVVAAGLCLLVALAFPSPLHPGRVLIAHETTIHAQPASTPQSRPPVATQAPPQTRDPPDSQTLLAAYAPPRDATVVAIARSAESVRARTASAMPARAVAGRPGAVTAMTHRAPPTAATSPTVSAPVVASATDPDPAAPSHPGPAANPREIATAALSQALVACAEQSVFARTWCEHRARVRYCDASRSDAPECVVALPAEHGG